MREVQEAVNGPDAEALNWRTRLLSGAMTPDERAAYHAWRARAPENARAIDALEAALERADDAATAALAEQFEAELSAAAGGDRTRRHVATGLAASLALMLAAGGALYSLRSPTIAPVAISTGVGEIRNATLDDGSAIAVNTRTELKIAYARNRRLATLARGEALFTVERDPERPFVVETPQAQIVVTGTVFDVAAIDGRSMVSVFSGAVDVRGRKSGGALLLAGDRIVIDASGDAGAVMRFDPSLAIAWRTGLARFRSAPLADVLAELNRYFPTPLILASDDMGSAPVTGDFDIRDQEAAIAALEVAFGLERRMTPAGVILERATR